MANIKKDLEEISEMVAKSLHLSNYTVNLNIEPEKGNGFLGEFYKGFIQTPKKTINMALKKAPLEPQRRLESSIIEVYTNEIRYYSEIHPALYQFQKDRGITEPFYHIPRYFASIGEPNKEIIAFEDLTPLGFQLRDMHLLLDYEHARFIFETYGRFHGVSFAYKDQKPEEYRNLTKNLTGALEQFFKFNSFYGPIDFNAKLAIEALDPVIDAAVLKKCKKFENKIFKVFTEAYYCDDDAHLGIMHGDCWSNNMMFKYDKEGKLEAMNLIDFQLFRIGSPVHDLSYFFYTGGSKALFDQLEDFLDIYHKSFCSTVRALGSDPDKLLPRDILTKHWKKYAKFGLFMSILLTKVKVMNKDDLIAATEYEGADKQEMWQAMRYDTKLFNERVRDMLVHMHEVDAL